MATNLSPENEQFIENVIAAGLYHDRDEALNRAVELLKKREQLIRDVNHGIEQLERGEGTPLDIEEIKSAAEKTTKNTKISKDMNISSW
jgi:antitoxin ParD1/3/4